MALYRYHKLTAAEIKRQETLFKASDECAKTMNELRKVVDAIPPSPVKELVEFAIFGMHEKSELYKHGLPQPQDRTLQSLIERNIDAFDLLKILERLNTKSPDSEAPKK